MFETYIAPILIFAILGLVAGVLLTVISKVFEVKTDERIEQINEALPQVNCGACGYSGCSDYANAIINDGAEPNQCKPGGAECVEKISAILGVSATAAEPQCAVVRCQGDCNSTKPKFTYIGTQSCAAANRFYQGSESCSFGCLGLADCAKVCQYGAITIENRLARIDKSKCMACGLCVTACPNHLIAIKPTNSYVDVRCSSTNSGKITRSVCSNGCIGCKICEKKCPEGAIKVIDNLASIDYSICTSCGLCAAGCPTGAISNCKALS